MDIGTLFLNYFIMSIGFERQNSVKLKLSSTKIVLTEAHKDKTGTLLIPTGICNGEEDIPAICN